MGIQLRSLGLGFLLGTALFSGARTAWSDEQGLDPLPMEYLALEREISLNRVWPGQPYEVLLDVFGEPMMALKIPGRLNTSEFVAVFGVVDTGSRCFDSFSIYLDEVQGYRVREYFCR